MGNSVSLVSNYCRPLTSETILLLMILYERQIRYGQKWIIKFAYILARGDATRIVFQPQIPKLLAGARYGKKKRRKTNVLLSFCSVWE